MISAKEEKTIEKSVYVSRDMSWLMFNYRVLDQVKHKGRNIFDRLKFMAICCSNLDEFFMIRVGSLYNYIDYNRDRIDYSGLNSHQFRKKLLMDIHQFVRNQYEYYQHDLEPEFEKSGFKIVNINEIKDEDREKVYKYFTKTIFPMLTPMLYDNTHTFPVLMNKVLTFAVVTQNDNKKDKEVKRLTFVQVPQNLPRFYEIVNGDKIQFLPIEEIIRWQIQKMFRNVEIQSVTLFRITRNGDFTEDIEDTDTNFLDEMKKKLNTRKTARVVRLEIEPNATRWLTKVLLEKFEIDDFNVFEIKGLIDFTGFNHILRHPDLRNKIPSMPKPVAPLSFDNPTHENLFDYLKHKDLLMHHPYNGMEPVIHLLEMAATDPGVLAIKMTIYRLAKDSRITNALLKAANNGKHVSVLFEVKARFDEEHNMHEAEKLQKAGCFVIYGVGTFKTHTKLMLIVRQEEDKITRFVHISSGNYNEITSKFYTDLGLLTTNEGYANDVSEFFNVVTGHSQPENYQYLITAPHNMRMQLTQLIRNEIENAKKGLQACIVWKVNSLQDKDIIDELYKASQAGVSIRLIVRGICCLRPNRVGLSSNIEVYSLVGDYLEHARIFYFHNNGMPLIYSGSADAMVRSFDRRIESLYLIVDENLKKEVINILAYNLMDNVNSYIMQEDASYLKINAGDKKPFNVHKEFYNVTEKVFCDVADLIFKKKKVQKENPEVVI